MELRLTRRRSFETSHRYEHEPPDGLGRLGLTRALAEEVRRDGVKVTAIVPGAVDTPFWERAGGRRARERMLRPEAVAEAILFAAVATTR